MEGDTFPAVTEMEREEATVVMMLPDIIVTDASADCAVRARSHRALAFG